MKTGLSISREYGHRYTIFCWVGLFWDTLYMKIPRNECKDTKYERNEWAIDKECSSDATVSIEVDIFIDCLGWWKKSKFFPIINCRACRNSNGRSIWNDRLKRLLVSLSLSRSHVKTWNVSMERVIICDKEKSSGKVRDSFSRCKCIMHEVSLRYRMECQYRFAPSKKIDLWMKERKNEKKAFFFRSLFTSIRYYTIHWSMREQWLLRSV